MKADRQTKIKELESFIMYDKITSIRDELGEQLGSLGYEQLGSLGYLVGVQIKPGSPFPIRDQQPFKKTGLLELKSSYISSLMSFYKGKLDTSVGESLN